MRIQILVFDIHTIEMIQKNTSRKPRKKFHKNNPYTFFNIQFATLFPFIEIVFSLSPMALQLFSSVVNNHIHVCTLYELRIPYQNLYIHGKETYLPQRFIYHLNKCHIVCVEHFFDTKK